MLGGQDLVSHLTRHAAKSAMKHEPAELFREAFLHVILQRVRELCQTEDNLEKRPEKQDEHA